MNVPYLSFSLVSRNRRKKSPSSKKNITKKQVEVVVFADEFQDLSPTEEMINKRHSKNGVDNNINTLKKEIKKLTLMTDGKDHSDDIHFLKKQIKHLEKRHQSPKKGGKRRTSRKF